VTGPAAGGPWINVWHISNDGSVPVATTVNQVAANIRAFYVALTQTIANVGPVLAPNMSIAADFATDVQTQAQVPVTFAPVTTGTFGTQAPTRLSMTVTWKTNIAARRATGRTFIPPMQAAVIDNLGLPKQGVRDAVLAAGAGVVTSNASVSGGGLVVYGLVTPKGGPKDPHQGYAVARATVRTKFSTLRTRG
jgi:hypothetical protein